MPEQETDPSIVEAASTPTPSPAETTTPVAAQSAPDSEDRSKWTDQQWLEARKGLTSQEQVQLRDERASITRSARWEENVGQHIPNRDALKGDFWRAMAAQFSEGYPTDRALKNEWIKFFVQ